MNKMKNFKKIKKKHIITLSTFFCCFLLGTSNFILFKDTSNLLKTLLFFATITYTIIGFIIVNKNIYKQEQIEKNKKKQELEDKYLDYTKLVYHHIHKIPKNILIDNQIIINNNHEYLLYFHENLNRIKKHQIHYTIDSFFIASCLIYSLINYPTLILNTPSDDTQLKQTVFDLNFQIAINCALDIISQPITYYQDSNKNCTEEKHPKVKIIVPNGIIKDCKLISEIKNAILNDYYRKSHISILYFSNILHLIYLYSFSEEIKN